ncbi:MAG: hypothetical protein KME21_20170 [Desmonostoc vinosum HA7617-LM4]|jgi:hypothetical protein|nr:hypothetical protein [Desmonostoc vinosum HA7617-LM4]
MENSQNVQHEPTQIIGATPELTNSKSISIKSSSILINLVAHHPWLLFTGLLAMLLGSAAVALYSISHVGRVAEEEPEKIPEVVVEQPITTPSENSNPTPLWMVAAIALSCGSGCLIIFRLFNRSKQPLKVPKPSINRHQAHLTQSRYPKTEPRLPKNPPVFVPQQQLTPVTPLTAKSKPLVTVLPPEHKHHLDKRQESLAELLDIRKQSSLSTILQKN